MWTIKYEHGAKTGPWCKDYVLSDSQSEGQSPSATRDLPLVSEEGERSRYTCPNRGARMATATFANFLYGRMAHRSVDRGRKSKSGTKDCNARKRHVRYHWPRARRRDHLMRTLVLSKAELEQEKVEQILYRSFSNTSRGWILENIADILNGRYQMNHFKRPNRSSLGPSTAAPHAKLRLVLKSRLSSAP